MDLEVEFASIIKKLIWYFVRAIKVQSDSNRVTLD